MIAQDLEFIYLSLMSRTKIELSILGDMLGCKLKSNLRKFEMATGLADYIINRSDEWLRCLPQRELDLMEMMVKMEKGSEFRTFPQPYGTVMEAFGFLIEETTDDSSTFTIVPALYDSIKEHLPMALSFRATNSYMEFEALLMGILNIYGIVEHMKVFEIFSSIYDFETDPQLTVQSMRFLYESFLMKMDAVRKNGLLYHMTMVRNEDLDEVIPERENRAEIKDYRQFSKEEFMAAGFDQLYPFVGKDSPAGKKLTAFMKKVGMGEEERNVIGTLVWLSAQEGGTKGPHMGFGMGAPRVGRNDPCPCGSGLKYKNCHGKYNS